MSMHQEFCHTYVKIGPEMAFGEEVLYEAMNFKDGDQILEGQEKVIPGVYRAELSVPIWNNSISEQVVNGFLEKDVEYCAITTQLRRDGFTKGL